MRRFPVAASTEFVIGIPDEQSELNYPKARTTRQISNVGVILSLFQ